MGIYIKGMEMPKEGFSTTIRIHADGTVYVCGAYPTELHKAIYVPPHGDLIDAQEEMKLMRSYDYDTYDDYFRAFDMLDNAPTIIPEEAEMKGEQE